MTRTLVTSGRAAVLMLGSLGQSDMAQGYPGCECALDVLIDAPWGDLGLHGRGRQRGRDHRQQSRVKSVAFLEALKKRASAVDDFLFVEHNRQLPRA